MLSRPMLFITLTILLITVIAISTHFISSSYSSISNEINKLNNKIDYIDTRLHNITRELEELKTITLNKTRNKTTIIYKPIIIPCSQDPSISINVKIENITDDGTLLKFRVYITNNGNTTKKDLLLVIITYDEQEGYKTTIKYIDEIEPGITLRFDFTYTQPTITRYYICVLTPNKP
ncbi:hypothetical protein J4526_00420 [Desulfurococcaceae archaeon MEX13E-LK6-19]|nr:hypothetical protein J4526_00420 [Desulfurococcaceae archaeon MEX13E-LK6-19]